MCGWERKIHKHSLEQYIALDQAASGCCACTGVSFHSCLFYIYVRKDCPVMCGIAGKFAGSFHNLLQVVAANKHCLYIN